MLVAPSMGPTVVRSSLEVMLDSLRQRDEKPKDLMPALPIRPISKGRLPSCRRPRPVKFNIESNGFEDPKKEEIASDEEVGQQTLQGVLCVQKHFRGVKARRNFQELKNGITPLQSFIRGWLGRKHFNGLRNLELSNTNYKKVTQGPDFKVKELVDSNKEQPQGVIVVVQELQSRALKAEAALKIKEEENLALRRQMQQYETRWSDYEEKMRTMEEMWQKQLTSLQASLAEAKRSLAANDRTVQQVLHDKSPNNHHSDTEDTTSQEFQTPESTPVKQPHAPAAILPINSNGTRTAVSHMVKEFEQKKKDFEDDARLLIEGKCGQSVAIMNPVEDLQKLKVRFTSWKKDYKVKLRETKVELQKIGNLETAKARRKWWIFWGKK